MTFSEFKNGMNLISTKSKISTRVFVDKDTGKFIAKFKDGTVITGNSYSDKITVLYRGKNHMAMTTLTA